EPFSNWGASLTEDVAVGGLLWLAFVHPAVALAVLVLLVALVIWLLPRVWRALTRLLARISGWFGHSTAGPR
ncbi:MAG TPA: DUF4126 domain-containing protein, partial [Casimicrobiaceae bacterium]|nr:DUF4126 domain-containing protein [Casimicrobiaceae bacterium]